jgi:hypothetical protein
MWQQVRPPFSINLGAVARSLPDLLVSWIKPLNFDHPATLRGEFGDLRILKIHS